MPIRVTQSWGTTPFTLGVNLLASTTQVKVGSESLHRFSVFPVIKSVMAQRKNRTQNERSYGSYERFPFLMTGRLDFGHSILEEIMMGLPPSERSASEPSVQLVLLFQ